MSDPVRLSFLQACGGSGPLSISVQPPDQPATAPQEFWQPSLLIGRHERADLRLGDPAVSQRHAYLQLIAGRLLCIDLESRTGTLHRGERVSFTWLDPRDTIQIGPYRLDIRLGAPGAGASRGPGAPAREAPIGFGQWKSSLRPADVEVLRDGQATMLWPMSQMIALVGGSSLCHLRLMGKRVTRFAFSLVRTPLGVWMVDLGSSNGVRINDDQQALALLAEGDQIPIGPYQLVMRYGDRPDRAGSRPAATTLAPVRRPPAPAQAVPTRNWAELTPASPSNPSVEQLLPAVHRLLEQVVQVQHQMSEQLPQAITLITQAFGALQRDQLAVVRDELAEIRRLNQEIVALRTSGPAAAARPGQGDPVTAATPADAAPTRAPERQGSPAPEPELPYLPEPPRFAPQQVSSYVNEQLARVERERRSRWRKLLRAMLSQ